MTDSRSKKKIQSLLKAEEALGSMDLVKERRPAKKAKLMVCITYCIMLIKPSIKHFRGCVHFDNESIEAEGRLLDAHTPLYSKRTTTCEKEHFTTGGGFCRQRRADGAGRMMLRAAARAGGRQLAAGRPCNSSAAASTADVSASGGPKGEMPPIADAVSGAVQFKRLGLDHRIPQQQVNSTGSTAQLL